MTIFRAVVLLLVGFSEINCLKVGSELGDKTNFLSNLAAASDDKTSYDDNIDLEMADPRLLKRFISAPLTAAMPKSVSSSPQRYRQFLLPQNDFRSIKNRRSNNREVVEETDFAPAGSVDALTNLNGFFDNIGQSIQLIESDKPSPVENKFLPGSNLNHHLRKDYFEDKPSGSAAFLHAIRNYRPSHRIRSLVAMHPPGYATTRFNDPNYLWAGLGK